MSKVEIIGAPQSSYVRTAEAYILPVLYYLKSLPESGAIIAKSARCLATPNAMTRAPA